MFKLLFLALFLTSSFAYSSTEQILCEEVSQAQEKIQVRMMFDPAVVQNTIWKKNEKGDYIQVYHLGQRNFEASTTARISVFLPPRWNGNVKVGRANPAGHRLMEEFYEVNAKVASSPYLKNIPARSFHGHAMQGFWQFQIQVPEAIIGKPADRFPGFIGISNDMMDQGHYPIALLCASRIKAQ